VIMLRLPQSTHSRTYVRALPYCTINSGAMVAVRPGAAARRGWGQARWSGSVVRLAFVLSKGAILSQP
jgi:hypothetical protein